jgi:hypothetical protein
MNRKNRILTMLAFLNCVHTTHAVEKIEKSEDVNIQQDGQNNALESWDALEAQCTLQNLRIFVAQKTGNPDWDAVIQKEKTMQKVYARMKGEYTPDDPFWSLYEGLECISYEIVDDSSKRDPNDRKGFSARGLDIRFNNKIKKWVKDGKIKGIKDLDDLAARGNVDDDVYDDVDEPSGNAFLDMLKDLDRLSENAYVEALRDMEDMKLDLVYWDNKGIVPGLDLLGPNWDHTGVDLLDPKRPFCTKEEFALSCDQYMQNLEKKYPDIAHQRRGVYKKKWAHDLNSGIKKGEAWIANIGDVILLLAKSNTQTGRELKETVLDTLRNNLLGADQDLIEKTNTLLQQNPVLEQEMRRIQGTIVHMTMKKTIKPVQTVVWPTVYQTISKNL